MGGGSKARIAGIVLTAGALVVPVVLLAGTWGGSGNGDDPAAPPEGGEQAVPQDAAFVEEQAAPLDWPEAAEQVALEELDVLIPVADTWVQSSVDDCPDPAGGPGACPVAATPRDTDAVLRVGHGEVDGVGAHRHALLQFDVFLDHDVRLVEANLHLTVVGDDDVEGASLVAVEAPWDGSDVTTFDQPPLADEPRANIDLVAGGEVAVDVTALVEQWLHEPESNHGLAIVASPEASREALVVSVDHRTHCLADRTRCLVELDEDTLTYDTGYGMPRLELTVLWEPQGPDVRLDLPSWDGEVLWGTEELAISWSSSGGPVVSVAYFASDVLIGVVDATASTWLAWDTTEVPDGEYVLRAEARDSSGRVGVSDPVRVIVDQRGGARERLADDFVVGTLSEEDYVRYGFYSVFAPERVPEEYRLLFDEEMDVTGLLFDVLVGWDHLDPELQEELSEFMSSDMGPEFSEHLGDDGWPHD